MKLAVRQPRWHRRSIVPPWCKSWCNSPAHVIHIFIPVSLIGQLAKISGRKYSTGPLSTVQPDFGMSGQRSSAASCSNFAAKRASSRRSSRQNGDRPAGGVTTGSEGTCRSGGSVPKLASLLRHGSRERFRRSYVVRLVATTADHRADGRDGQSETFPPHHSREVRSTA